MKFVIMSIVLTWIWIWLFRKMVVEQLDELPKPNSTIVSYTSFIPQEDYEEPILLRPKLSRSPRVILSRNPLVLLWYGAFTYLMFNIWKIWLNFYFGIFPGMDNDDDFE